MEGQIRQGVRTNSQGMPLQSVAEKPFPELINCDSMVYVSAVCSACEDVAKFFGVRVQMFSDVANENRGGISPKMSQMWN